MGKYRPIKVKDWIKFLEAHKCKRKRTKASHTHFQCPGCLRNIVFRETDKDIPAFHISQNLKSMGYDIDYLLDWLKKN